MATGETAARHVAICYLRRSENEPDHRISIERQRANCQAEAARNGWHAEFYAEPDGHRSGRTEKHRPAWAEAKANFDRQDVAALIVESLSRACRSARDASNLIELLNQRGIRLVSVNERVSTDTAAGLLFAHMLAAVAQFESDIAAERMAMTIEFRRKQKGLHWGRTPFGCSRNEEHHLMPALEGVWRAGSQMVIGRFDQPPFADLTGVEWRGYHDALHAAYEWYAAGDVSISKLAGYLNAAGYRFRGRTGMPRQFNDQDVRRLLDMNRIYAGYVVRGAAKKRSGDSWKGGHKPILEPELCDRVASMLTKRHALGKRFDTRRGTDRIYPMTPLLYCGVCGRRMSGAFQDGKQWYRHEDAKQCGAKGQIAADALEAQLLERLQSFRVPGEIRERIEYLARQLAKAAATPEADRARSDVQRITRKLENLKELRIEGEIGKMEYDRRKQQLAAQLREAQQRVPETPADVRLIETLLSKIDQIADVVRSGSPAKRKELYGALFVRFEQNNGELTAVEPKPWARALFAER